MICYFRPTYNGGGKSSSVMRFFKQILPNLHHLHPRLDYFLTKIVK